MRFMVMVKGDKDTEAGEMPGEALLEAMGRYNEELVKARVMLSGDGLHPSSKGAKVLFRGAERIVTDGPFAEAKELIAGYWMLKADSLEEAIEWVKKCPNPTGEESEIEIRQVFELADFEPSEALEIHSRLREEMARKPVASRVVPYLLFKGQCEEAFRFYAETLGGKIEVMTRHAGTPGGEHVPAGMQEKILHARMSLGSQVLMASDTPAETYTAPQEFMVALLIDDPGDAERAFTALSEGGSVTMPIGETCWSVRFGMCVDRFGIPWMVNCEKAA
jgi:PhnB protein